MTESRHLVAKNGGALRDSVQNKVLGKKESSWLNEKDGKNSWSFLHGSVV